VTSEGVVVRVGESVWATLVARTWGIRVVEVKMARVEFRKVWCSGATVMGFEHYDWGSGYGADTEDYVECRACGRREYGGRTWRAHLDTPHERGMPDWAVYKSAMPHDPGDADWLCWWRAVAEVAALCGEDVGVVVLESEDVENEERWARLWA
jgi:hypothetical protein